MLLGKLIHWGSSGLAVELQFAAFFLNGLSKMKARKECFMSVALSLVKDVFHSSTERLGVAEAGTAFPDRINVDISDSCPLKKTFEGDGAGKEDPPSLSSPHPLSLPLWLCQAVSTRHFSKSFPTDGKVIVIPFLAGLFFWLVPYCMLLYPPFLYVWFGRKW